MTVKWRLSCQSLSRRVKGCRTGCVIDCSADVTWTGLCSCTASQKSAEGGTVIGCKKMWEWKWEKGEGRDRERCVTKLSERKDEERGWWSVMSPCGSVTPDWSTKHRLGTCALGDGMRIMKLEFTLRNLQSFHLVRIFMIHGRLKNVFEVKQQLSQWERRDACGMGSIISVRPLHS